MALRGAATTALTLAIFSFAAPASAQAARRAVAMYPVAGAEIATSDAADAQALLDAALRRAAQRSGEIVVANPALLRPSCGPAPTARAGCIAQLAVPRGLVLRATVHRAERLLVVALEAIGGDGRSVGPVSAAFDSYVQNAEPLVHAVTLLADQAFAAERRRDAERAGTARSPFGRGGPVAVRAPESREGPEPRIDLRAPEPSRAAAGARPESPASPAAPPTKTAASAAESASRAPATTATPAAAPGPGSASPVPAIAAITAAAPGGGTASPVPGAWMRTAGPWLTGAGAALLAGGVALAVVNQSRSDALERKFETGGLSPADRRSYDQIEQYNTMTAALFAAGGAFTVTGAAIWTGAPGRGGVTAGVGGRF
jgi:hypothetical protein